MRARVRRRSGRASGNEAFITGSGGGRQALRAERKNKRAVQGAGDLRIGLAVGVLEIVIGRDIGLAEPVAQHVPGALQQRRLVGLADARQVEAQNVAQLPSDLIHYSFQNLGELFAKPGRNFSSRSAKIMYQKGKRAHALSPALHGLYAFVRKYIFQLGLLAGVDGLTVALSSAMNSYLKYAKLLEYQRDPKVLQAEDFNKVW